MLQIGRYSPDFSQTGTCLPFGKRMRHRAFTGELSGQKRKKAIMQVVIFILTRLIFAGWFFFFCRFSMIHSVKNESQGVASVRKRRMQQCKHTQKKNANPASFLRDNLQCCTLHLKYFRNIATDSAIL